MEFFTSMMDVMSTIVIGIGAALGVWGGINLLAKPGGASLSGSLPTLMKCDY